jgi:hypothetical protein
MSQQVARLSVLVDAGPGADAEELDELTLQLRRELCDLEVESVELARSSRAPAGARAVDVLALGTLAVTLVKSSAVLTAVVNAVQAWLTAPGRRRVKLELDGDVLEVTGLSAADQRQLIASWIARHADPAERPGARR